MNLVYEIKYALNNGFTTVEKLIEKDGSIAYNGAFGYFVVSPGEANEIDALIAQYVTTPENAKEIDEKIAQYKPEEKAKEIEAPVSISPRLARLVESLEKSEAKVEKIKSTIERHHKQLEKKVAYLTSKGFEIDYSNVNFKCKLSSDFKKEIAHIEKIKWDGIEDRESDEGYETFWKLCEVVNKLEDIHGSHRKLSDAEKVVENWNVKIVAEHARTNIAASAPKVIVDFVNEWGELAFEWYMSNLNYPDETRVKRMVENEKQIKIIQLTSNVISVVGTITDARGLSIGEKGDLIGIIEGEKGSARVETISAGGYNIQKFHYRTIINKI